MSDVHSYWEWRDALLRHPDGRAKGGEPCVKCEAPVPPNAHWKHRDRRVCGERCNANLGRQINRRLKTGVDLPIPRPEPMADPRHTPAGHLFRTVPVDGPDLIPYEFDGFGPGDGDAVERHGVLTRYSWLRPEALPNVPSHARHGLFVAQHDSGHFFMQASTPSGLGSRLLHGQFDPSGRDIEVFSPFDNGHERLVWRHELIRAVTTDGREYDWEAIVCVPAAAGHPGALWSPEYAARSQAKRRASSSTARSSRRLRLAHGTLETFDPHEIYDRDGWTCRLCHQPVDPDLRWPDPHSASLDHTVPLAAYGAHSRANTQLAHWLCNVRKGARTT